MLDLLKIVLRATQKGGGILSNVKIADGTVDASNGRISVRATVPELDGITAVVSAERLVKAVAACKGAPEVKTTATNLIVKSGGSSAHRFSARIPLNATDFPEADYDSGQGVGVPAGFLDNLAAAVAFTSEDFKGVLLRGEQIIGVSRNAMIAMDGTPVPHDVVLPLETVKDLLAAKEPPTAMRVGEGHATFDYPSFQLRTQLNGNIWPNVAPLLDWDADKMGALPTDWAEAVRTVAPFGKTVIFTGDAATAGPEGSEATVEGVTVPASGFVTDTLLAALGHAERFAVAARDGGGEPLMRFAGAECRGVLAGVKVDDKHGGE